MSPFEALLRYAFLEEAQAAKVVHDFCVTVAGARDDGAERATDAAYKLARTPSQAAIIIRRLSQHNAALEEALARSPEGRCPELPASTLDACNAQLSKYTAQIIKFARIDAWRKAKRRKEVATIDEDRAVALAGQRTDLDDAGLLEVAKRVEASIKADRHREPWLDESLEQIQRLARGEVTMDELTHACIEGDPSSFSDVPSDKARDRARNRLQKRHQRARERLREEGLGLVSLGRMTEDEGRMAEEYVVLLMRRRQKTRARTSGGAR